MVTVTPRTSQVAIPAWSKRGRLMDAFRSLSRGASVASGRAASWIAGRAAAACSHSPSCMCVSVHVHAPWAGTSSCAVCRTHDRPDGEHGIANALEWLPIAAAVRASLRCLIAACRCDVHHAACRVVVRSCTRDDGKERLGHYCTVLRQQLRRRFWRERCRCCRRRWWRRRW
jgi:hypothetical protein